MLLTPLLLVVLVFFATPSVGLYSPPSDKKVVKLTKENFESNVYSENNELWIVYSYNQFCTDCEEFAPSFQAIIKAVQGVARIGVINTEKEADLVKELDIRKDPTLKVIDASFPKPKTYTGSLVKERVIDYILNVLREKVKTQGKVHKDTNAKNTKVIELADYSFNPVVIDSTKPWIVMFYTTRCGLCDILKPIYKQVADELRNEIKCASINIKYKEIYTHYRVTTTPMLLYFPAGRKDENTKPDKYLGQVDDKEPVLQWARALNHFPITEITDEDTFKAVCKDVQLCIISFLPHIKECGAGCRNDYLEMVTEASEAYRSDNWGWTWTEGGAQDKLEAALGVSGSPLPTMVAASIKKMKYCRIKGPYTVKGIKDFLRGVPSGMWRVSPIKNKEMPKINTVERWDGKDLAAEDAHNEL